MSVRKYTVRPMDPMGIDIKVYFQFCFKTKTPPGEFRRRFEQKIHPSLAMPYS